MKKITAFIICLLFLSAFSFAQSLQIMKDTGIMGTMTYSDKNILGTFSSDPDHDKQLLRTDSEVPKSNLSPQDEERARKMHEAYESRQKPEDKYMIARFLDFDKTYAYTLTADFTSGNCSAPITTKFYTLPVTVDENGGKREVFYGVSADYASHVNVAGSFDAVACGYTFMPKISASASMDNGLNLVSKVNLKIEVKNGQGEKDLIVCNLTISSASSGAASARVNYGCNKGKAVYLENLQME